MRQKVEIFFKSMIVKFVLAFIIVGLMPIMGVSYIIFERLPKETESYMVASYEEALLYSSKNIGMKLRAYDLLTQSIYEFGKSENKTLADIINKLDYAPLSLEDQGAIEVYLLSLLYSDSDIESVFLVDEQKTLLNYSSKSTSYYYENLDLTQIDKFGDITLNNRTMTVLPTHKEDYFRQQDKQVVTIARNYLDTNYLPEREKVVSTLLLEINLDFIDGIINRMELTNKGTIAIVDTTGYNIYQSDKNSMSPTEIYGEIEDRVKGTLSGNVIDGDQYIFYQNIEDTDWLIMYKVDKSNVMRLIDDMRTLTTVLMYVIVVALLVVTILFSSGLSKPIRSIIAQMKKVSEGDLTTQVEVKASYEMNQLAVAFNKMTERLRSYIDQAYGAKIKQREAELNALKTQIRPHYLYNTLEIIRMSALEEGASETKEMIVSLSEQLKYVIGQYGDRVDLGMELDMIENYFKIIRVRYEGRITLEIDVPKEYYRIKVLKLILQPLVENAVIHGLKVKKGKGKVKVSAKLTEAVLEVEVIDDGIGINEATVQEIRTLLDSDEMGKELDGNWENIGLKNVHDRIQMNYGDAYGLSIITKEKLGTKMRLRIPVE